MEALGNRQMRVLQRTIAIILMLALLPSSIAAALPLVYCIGADGHRAIEPYHASHNHGVAQTSSEDSLEHSGCIDVELATIARLVRTDSKSARVAIAVNADPPAHAWHETVRSGFLPRHRPRSELTALRLATPVDPLTAHRTVVLLI